MKFFFYVQKKASLGVVLLILVVIYLPILWMGFTAIKSTAETFSRPIRWLPTHPTLSHFWEILQSPKYLRFFANSFIVSISVSVIVVILAASAAYGLSRYEYKGSNLVLIALLLSQMIPPILLVIPYFQVMRSIHLLNTYFGVILALCGYTLPFSTWLLRGYFLSIPKDIDEAALIDGCTPFSVFTKITLPLAKPGIVATSIFSFLWAWSDYLFVLILTSSDKYKTIPVGIAEFVGQYSINWNTVMALTVLAVVPVALMLAFFQRQLIYGLTGGAVKG